MIYSGLADLNDNQQLTELNDHQIIIIHLLIINLSDLNDPQQSNNLNDRKQLTDLNDHQQLTNLNNCS